MNFIVLSVRDRAVEAFGRPIFVPAVGAGIRSFQDEINRVAEDNLMNRHPDDYDLYELGRFDDSSGRFHLLEEPRQIAIGKQLLVNGRT